MSPFKVQTIIPAWRECVSVFLAYNYHTFGQLPDLNDLSLEGLIHKAIKTQREDVEWVKGAHLPWDLSLKENNFKIQVKGTLLSGNKMHLSAFRLGLHAASPTSLKEGILKMVTANDVWYVVAREIETPEQMRVNFFECNKESFLYNPDLYNLQPKTTKKRTLFVSSLDGVSAKVIPSTSHQLLYSLNYDKFKTMAGVELIDSTLFDIKSIPTTLNLV